MKHGLILGLLATLALAATPAPAVDQDVIDRAIEKGVQALRKMQQPDGTWPYQPYNVGATALAGLTLFECGAEKDDKNVSRAAEAVRQGGVDLTNTYSIALSLIFLDLLGDPDDEPLIKSLVERLLAGQDAASGGWSYSCPGPSDAEKHQLQGKASKHKEKADEKPKDDNARADPRQRPRPPISAPPGGGAPGLPPLRVPAPDVERTVGGPGDNSNTQFATLGLWIGRRHKAPVDDALTRVANRFRSTQMADGGWPYYSGFGPGGPGFVASTPAMTCAGLIALAIADGAYLDSVRRRKPDAKLPEAISSDKHLKRGLEALGAVIDNPRGLKGGPERPFVPPGAPAFPAANQVGGNSYYFLWSLERVAMALDLKTIGNKDWYNWGAEILLENQLPDGTWNGAYGAGGVDTCFALLFLKRANLVRDLTARLKGKVKDPGERVLSAGRTRAPGPKMVSGIETKGSKPLLKVPSSESGRLAQSLLNAKGRSRDELLDTMESEKGVKYTEALALAIPRLEGDTHRKARAALANRLTRMRDETLKEYFQDEDPEIRRAAALAAGQKDSNALVPNLITLLRDSEIDVARAAHASLKALTAQDFGPAAAATREERDQAVQKWIAWWSKHREK